MAGRLEFLNPRVRERSRLSATRWNRSSWRCGLSKCQCCASPATTGEVFDYPGVYVSDGAAIPSALAVNTSLTILANAERIAAGLIERYRLAVPAQAA